jgi:hypothetical protein
VENRFRLRHPSKPDFHYPPRKIPVVYRLLQLNLQPKPATLPRSKNSAALKIPLRFSHFGSDFRAFLPNHVNSLCADPAFLFHQSASQ